MIRVDVRTYSCLIPFSLLNSNALLPLRLTKCRSVLAGPAVPRNRTKPRRPRLRHTQRAFVSSGPGWLSEPIAHRRVLPLLFPPAPDCPFPGNP